MLKLSSLFMLSGSLPLLSLQSARAEKSPDAPLRIGYLPITDDAAIGRASAKLFGPKAWR